MFTTFQYIPVLDSSQQLTGKLFTKTIKEDVLEVGEVVDFYQNIVKLSAINIYPQEAGNENLLALLSNPEAFSEIRYSKLVVDNETVVKHVITAKEVLTGEIVVMATGLYTLDCLKLLRQHHIPLSL